jgi:hypothetical protein
MKRYPCGFMMCGVCVEDRNPNEAKAVKISQVARSVSRMMAERFTASIELRFLLPVRVDTICALGPCVITRADVGDRIVHPYPTDEKGKSEPTLFVLCTQVLQTGHALRVELLCRPELFAFECDPEALEEEVERDARERLFRDAKGVTYVPR